jgi:hypothetical protein
MVWKNKIYEPAFSIKMRYDHFGVILSNISDLRSIQIID